MRRAGDARQDGRGGGVGQILEFVEGVVALEGAARIEEGGLVRERRGEGVLSVGAQQRLGALGARAAPDHGAQRRVDQLATA